MYFIIYGEDNYRARKTLAAARAQFIAARDASGMNSAVLRSKDDDLERVAEAVFSSPFLSEKKLVILEDYLGLPAADQQRLEDIINRKPESTVVIFFESVGADDIRKAHLFQKLSEQKFSAECRPLDARAVGRFIKDECAVEGLTIEPKASQTLLALVGLDSWRLHQELAKLCSYAAGSGLKTISEGMVGELVSGGQEESIFVFMDACTEGRQRQAVLALEKLFISGVAELQIVAMLMRQFRLMISAQDFLQRGGREPEILAKKLGQHPFPVGKAMAAARRFSFDFLKERYRDLVGIDRSIKTGTARPKVLLDIFAARLSAACAMPEHARP
jgi:DNA polymerase-3 subunit delta